MAPNHFNPENKNIYHGYFPFLPSDVSHKEFYDMPRPLEDISDWERNGCPLYEFIPWVDSDPEQTYEKVRIAFVEHFRRMHALALKLLSCLSIGVGKSANYFDPWFKDECSSVFRAIRYEPRKNGGAGLDLKTEELKLVTPEHTDSGFITLLSTFMFQGLQVEIDGEYKSI